MNRLLNFVILSCLAFTNLFAFAEGSSHPVNLRPGKGDQPSGPSRPAFIPFSCSFNGQEIILSSASNLYVEVEVVNEAGEVLAEGGGCLKPELVIPVDDFSGPLTIYIVVNEMTYVGYIE